MKTLPKMEISEDIEAQIIQGVEISDLCKSDVIRQALKIGLPQFAARFEARDLADILRVSVPGFAVFDLFYRWDGQTLT